MADDLEGEEDERTVELASLAAIYPELVLDEPGSDPFSATISIEVEPVEPLSIRFPSADGAPPVGPLTPPHSVIEEISQLEIEENGVAPPTNEDVYRISHLPALNLRLSLPEGYPAEKPPVFYLESQYSWLPEQKLQELREAGHSLWEELGRDQVVFSYIDHLREAAERGFDMAQADDQVLEVSPDLKVSLLDFDLNAKRAKFERETFECGICLDAKKGIVCHRLLLCGHVFCVPCLQDYYNTCIIEGDIGSVKCIAPDCGKEPRVGLAADQIQPKKGTKDSTLEPSELLQIPLEQDTVLRYIKLKRKKRLESDKRTVYCPRQWCQGPARTSKSKPDPGGETEGTDETEEPQTYDRNGPPEKLPPPAERLAICEDCNFAFCKVCKASWHGEYFTCFPRSQFELTAEEKASEDYMKLHTQPCPTCDARAQKTHGCNHMICFKCDTHFCYLCGAYLDKANPYQHYNTVKSGCYMRLWELERGDDGEFGLGFGGGLDGLPFDVDDDEDEDDDPAPVPVAAVAAQFVPLAPLAPPVPFGPPRPQPPAIRPARGRDPGLQRFLMMARDDEEDEWDSDDLSDISDDEWDDDA
ncbi:hypothetical protein HO173_000093 [Letharia columbiana]|uniref:RBR-type E3 ubiquitin transferase n=1 Tax=Letharia columbiana TaxID=112416 RepID=A0A8H6G687_9LECA|nr:uncharacterized protein HO173_000093 [Letharia columbiana]KAF6241383.1 hypothetical protein HO173_000093 [Letharia columbiana]